MKDGHDITDLCRVLDVGRSSFYDWKNRPVDEEELALRERIGIHFRRNRCSYGHRSIRDALRKEGWAIGRKKVLRLMKEDGLVPTPSLPQPYGKSSGGEHRVVKNRLDRQFHIGRANRVWTTDITYIWTSQGWSYLAVILDLFSRRVVGWHVSEHPDTDLVMKALMMAVRQRKPRRWRLMIHSDQGCQYTSRQYRQTLHDLGILQSMSRRGQCWDNAPTESFFSTMKRETGISRWILDDCQAVELAMVDWIETWYNPIRRHTKLGGYSPAEFELKKAA
jgi:putative transposase